MAYLEAAEGEDLAESPTDVSEIYIEAGREFSNRHPWVVDQIEELTTKTVKLKEVRDRQPACSWLFGKEVFPVNATDAEMPMHIVHIGDKRIAIVDDPSRETLSKLIDDKYAAMVVVTKEMAPAEEGEERKPNHLEEGLISLVDPHPTLFIDPEFRGK